MLRLRSVPGASTHVYADGEVDLSTADQLGEALMGSTGEVVLHCGGLRFVDASFIRVLATAQRAIEARNAALTLVEMSRPVLLVLRLCGLEEHFGDGGGRTR